MAAVAKEMKEWPKEHRLDLAPYENDLFYEKFLQFMFYLQWGEIRAYAHEHGIKIMGDIPFYVGLDSADVWVDRSSFLLEEDGSPSCVAEFRRIIFRRPDNAGEIRFTTGPR